MITRNANANIANGSYWYEECVNRPAANESVGNPVSEPEKINKLMTRTMTSKPNI